MDIKTFMAAAVVALTAACTAEQPAADANATAVATDNGAAAGGPVDKAENVKEK